MLSGEKLAEAMGENDVPDLSKMWFKLNLPFVF